MKKLVTIYCEGISAKIGVFDWDKSGLIIDDIFSVNTNFDSDDSKEEESLSELDVNSLSGEIEVEEKQEEKEDNALEIIAEVIKENNLHKAEFIPVISEPGMNYHIYEGELPANRKKAIDTLVTDIFDSKGISVSPDSVDYVKIAEGNNLVLFVDEDISCVNFINGAAGLNRKKYYHIPKIMSAELALAHNYLSTLEEEEEGEEPSYKLIVYAGKFYSKFIFIKGNEIKHIGSTIDIGTENLSTYDVYFSKILLEMEHGGISNLNKIIIASQEDSSMLEGSFEAAFPQAEIENFKLEHILSADYSVPENKRLSEFTIPICTAYEYYTSLAAKKKSYRILPDYIAENQKFFQFGWHSFAMLPLLFGATYFFTNLILTNNQAITSLDREINRLTEIRAQNEELITELSGLEKRVNEFDQTQTILDSLNVNTKVWSDFFDKVSGFMELRRNFWITNLEYKNSDAVLIRGYTLSRRALTEFAEYNENTTLNNVIYEPLRDMTLFSYTLSYGLQLKKGDKSGS